MRMISHQTENIKKETEIIKRNQIEIIKQNKTKSLEGLKSSIEQVEEKICDLKRGQLKLHSLKKRKKNEEKLTELRDLSDNKCTNICKMGVPEEEEKKEQEKNVKKKWSKDPKFKEKH